MDDHDRDGPTGPGGGSKDMHCVVRMSPDAFVGDAAEVWHVIYAQHYRGINPMEGVAHAVYMAPQFYPVVARPVTPDGAAVRPVSVLLSTGDGTATSPDDYQAVAAQLVTVAPGETTAHVSIEVVPDSAAEDDETFRLLLADPVNGRLPPEGDSLPGAATATIQDDDSAAPADADTPDVRGTWRFQYKRRDLVAKYTISITDQDPQTGAFSGTFKVVPWQNQAVERGKVSGRVVGDQLQLKVSGTDSYDYSAKLILKMRKGNLTMFRQDGSLNFVLTDPLEPN